jgi:hypothetical protein
MQLHKHLFNTWFGKAALAAAALVGASLFAGTPSAHAQEWGVRPAIRYHGPVVVAHPYRRFYAPAPVVPVYRHPRFWRDRFGCLHPY